MVPDPKKQAKKLDDLRSQLVRRGYGPDAKGPARVFPADELRHKIGRARKRAAEPIGTGTTLPDKTAAKHSPVAYRRNLPRQQNPVSPPGAPLPPTRQKLRLEDAIAGIEVTREAGGNALLIETAVGTLDGGPVICGSFRELLADPDSPMRRNIARSCGVQDLALGDMVFMDLETTGLGTSPLFLVGVMIWAEGAFVVKQFLARHYGEEAAVIGLLADLCAHKRILITFNGKSFDMPFVRLRAIANGMLWSADPTHLDLLHACRRIWKDRLPNCKLQTLERHVCHRVRQGDIPGCDIPDAYHAFVRTGNACRMVEILQHNVLDLVTMADIMTRFPRRH